MWFGAPETRWGKSLQERLVGHNQIAVSREAAADLKCSDRRDRTALDLEDIGLPGSDLIKKVFRNIASLGIDQRHVSQGNLAQTSVDGRISEGFGRGIDAEHIKVADRPVRLLPLDLAVVERRRFCDPLHGQRLEHALARQWAAIGQRVHVGRGDHDVGAHLIVGQPDAGNEGTQEAELHQDQDGGEGHACQGRGEPRLVMDELKPADRQATEHALEESRHRSLRCAMRAVTCRFVKR